MAEPSTQQNNQQQEPTTQTAQQQSTTQTAVQATQQQNSQIPSWDELMQDKGFQAEFDRRVAKALKTTQEKASQQSTQQASELDALKAQLQALSQRAETAERAALISKAGVDAKYADFVAFKAAENVSDTTDFATALTAYLKDNAQFLTQPAAPTPEAARAQAMLQSLGSMGGKTADQMTDEEYFAMRSASKK